MMDLLKKQEIRLHFCINKCNLIWCPLYNIFYPYLLCSSCNINLSNFSFISRLIAVCSFKILAIFMLIVLSNLLSILCVVSSKFPTLVSKTFTSLVKMFAFLFKFLNCFYEKFMSMINSHSFFNGKPPLLACYCD